MNKDKAYHQIALACLKTLRTNPSITATSPAKALYDAIDEAFSQQCALLLMELEDSQERLNAISALDDQRHNLADAKAIAKNKTQTH